MTFTAVEQPNLTDLRSNNDLNRLNRSMKHQDLINTCVFEQIQGLLFSDLSGPLSSYVLLECKNAIYKYGHAWVL